MWLAQPLIKSVLRGYNATILAYGQTGTGKTHTILGRDLWRMATEVTQLADVHGNQLVSSSSLESLDTDLTDSLIQESGLIPRVVASLFNTASEEGIVFDLTASYIEICNDRVYDLLSDQYNQADRVELEIRDSKNGDVDIGGLSSVVVESSGTLFHVLWKGAQNRAVRATDMNEQSSRSHTILQLNIKQTTPEGIIVSKFNLVDLAGSENLKKQVGRRTTLSHVKDVASINQSLSALTHCIAALVNPNRSHIPYRNSKLTRILRDSLGGNALTSIVLTLGPSESALDETLSTLQFASRAKKVMASPQVKHFSNSDLELQRYRVENQRLKQLLKQIYDDRRADDSKIEEWSIGIQESNNSTYASAAPTERESYLQHTIEALKRELEATKNDKSQLLLTLASVVDQQQPSEQNLSSMIAKFQESSITDNLQEYAKLKSIFLHENEIQKNLMLQLQQLDKSHESLIKISKQTHDEISLCRNQYLQQQQIRRDLLNALDRTTTTAKTIVPLDPANLPSRKNRKSSWREYVDPSTGYKYFHNQVTGETQWTRPE